MDPDRQSKACSTLSDVEYRIDMDAGANARGERQAVIEKQLMQQNTQASLPTLCFVSTAHEEARLAGTNPSRGYGGGALEGVRLR